MAIANADRPYGKILKGQTIPYGTLVGVSEELRLTYYTYGYKEDSMLPELPCPPTEYQEHVSPEEELFKKEMVGVVGEVLGSLTRREAKVLFVRFGIGLPQDYTLEEVGVMFGVTRERIRQIESKALRKLRHPSRADVFRKMLGMLDTKEEKTEHEKAQAAWAKEREAARLRDEADVKAKTKTSALKQREYEKQRRQFERQAMERSHREAQRVRDVLRRQEYMLKQKEYEQQERERVSNEDQRLRAKWEEIKPMVSDADWVEHLKTANPEMYKELKFLVGDIWGYNADKVWEMYAKK
jgi:flagellar biosynthesis GTPase FlhF